MNHVNRVYITSPKEKVTIEEPLRIITPFFVRTFYNDVEAEANQNFKNILRTYPRISN